MWFPSEEGKIQFDKKSSMPDCMYRKTFKTLFACQMFFIRQKFILLSATHIFERLAGYI